MQYVKNFNQHKTINESVKYDTHYYMMDPIDNKNQKGYEEHVSNKYLLEQPMIRIVSVEGNYYDNKRDIHILLSNGFYIDFIWEEDGRISYGMAAAYTKYIDLSNEIGSYIKNFDPDASSYTELAMEIFEDWYNGKFKINYKMI